MKTIYIIGAGQIGSRHLQALKNIKTPLRIFVIDPFVASLTTAKERYEAVPFGSVHHTITYSDEIPQRREKVDLAIIATSSNVRRHVIEALLKRTEVSNFILEKLLFQHKKDFFFIEELLAKKLCKAWVNCSMRTMPFYAGLKKYYRNTKTQCFVTGGNYGLITNAIHYIDYIAFLTNCYDYTLDISYFDPLPVKSKRKGFLELTGTLQAYFVDGSFGSFTSYREGDAPFMVEILNSEYRCISRESDSKALVSSMRDNWKWHEINTKIPLQSQMTTKLVEDILTKGDCPLPTLAQSSKLHVILLEELLRFLNKNTKKKFTYYPFT